MSFFTHFPRKTASVSPTLVPQRILDDVVGELKFDGHWFAGSVPRSGRCLRIIVAAAGSDIDSACLATARRASTELPVMIERAYEFLATFPGFHGIERIRTVFVPVEGVFDGEDGSFYLVFHCSEDRDPEARLRVHFRSWQPFTQGRDG